MFSPQAPVISQVVLSAELFETHVTRVRPFIGVCSFVDQEVVRLGKMTPAEPAYELATGDGGEAGEGEFGDVVEGDFGDGSVGDGGVIDGW